MSKILCKILDKASYAQLQVHMQLMQKGSFSYNKRYLQGEGKLNPKSLSQEECLSQIFK